MLDLNVEDEYHNYVLPMLEYWNNDPKIQPQAECHENKKMHIIFHFLLCIFYYQLDIGYITRMLHQLSQFHHTFLYFFLLNPFVICKIFKEFEFDEFFSLYL